MRVPLLLLSLALSASCLPCKNDGRYCSTVLAASFLSQSSLSYKCSFPVIITKVDIMKLDPTVYVTMKIGEYCPKTCCSVTSTTRSATSSSSTSTSTTTSTLSPTTTTTTEPTTTVFRSLLDKFNSAMDADGEFKSLIHEINFSSSATEGMERFKVYSETKKEVDEHNIQFQLGMSTFQMATNAFSVALDGEVAPLTLSLDGLKQSATVPVASASRKKRDTVETVDWRPYMSPILNQLTCGGCWAFSMVSMVEGFFAIQGYNVSSLSVQQLLTCDTNTDATYGVANVGCNGGYFQVAGSYLAATAERAALDIPFDLEDTDCDSSLYAPVVPTILEFDDGFISGNLTASQLITMEQNIEDKVRIGPVAVGMAVSQDIYNYASGIYDGECGSTINHAVVIVGFTDDYWIIRNSWGAAWGEEGHIRVKRTSGQDPCMLYSYWSQATAIGANETYTNPIAGAAVVSKSSTASTTSTTVNNSATDECGEMPCEEQCGCDYDDDDEEEEEEDAYEDEELSSSTSTAADSTSSSTTSSTTASRTTSTTRAKRTTTTAFRKTTTTHRSIFDKWADDWNDFWG